MQITSSTLCKPAEFFISEVESMLPSLLGHQFELDIVPIHMSKLGGSKAQPKDALRSATSSLNTYGICITLIS